MVVKAVNNTAGPDSLVSILLIFGAYPRMQSMDPPATTIIQKVATIKKTMEQVGKIQAKSQVIDALNTRNWPFVDLIYNLPLNSDILVWPKNNAGRIGK